MPSAPRAEHLFWGAVLAVAVGYEFHGVPLSPVVRQCFRTDTPLGKAAFVGAWAALTIWFVPHIVKEPAS